MSSNRTGKSLVSGSLARVIVVAVAVGGATWAAATMLATARAGQEQEELARPSLDVPSPNAVAAADEPASGATPASTEPAERSPQGVETRMRKRREAILATAHVDTSATRPGEADRGEPSEAEWRAAAEGMRQLSPNALLRIERGPRNTPARARMMRAMVDRHRELQRIQRRDPEQYKLEVEQTALEDEVFGAARRLMRESDMAGAYELRVQLRDMITKLVDLRIRNREARLQRLAATVDAERKRLEQDKGNRERMIDRQFGAVTKTRGGGGSSPGGSGPGGGGAPRDPLLPPLPPRPELGSPDGD